MRDSIPRPRDHDLSPNRESEAQRKKPPRPPGLQRCQEKDRVLPPPLLLTCTDSGAPNPRPGTCLQKKNTRPPTTLYTNAAGGGTWTAPPAERLTCDQGHGLESCIRLCTHQGVCLGFSLPLPLPACACARELARSLSNKPLKTTRTNVHNSQD